VHAANLTSPLSLLNDHGEAAVMDTYRIHQSKEFLGSTHTASIWRYHDDVFQLFVLLFHEIVHSNHLSLQIINRYPRAKEPNLMIDYP
jgi:hypothetical protein